MKYFFIIGRHTDLSIAEIEAALKAQKNDNKITDKGPDFVIFECAKPLEYKILINQLGGTIKVGEIVAETPKLSAENLVKFIPDSDKKIYFGFSLHGFQFNLSKLGLETKKILQANGLKVRFVSSKENPLSSVIVQKNHLLDQGAELVLMKTGSMYQIGRTLAVQPFELLSKLDYGRPARDSFSGMLPPKLAQIMLNLSETKPQGLIYDPFCGSGTILQQALVLGYNVMGSDISPKAISDTKTNLGWLEKETGIKAKYSIFLSDITKQSPLGIKINAIVTEPYLGPALKGRESREQIEKSMQNLTRLYRTSLQKFAEWLTPGNFAIMIIPKFQQTKKAWTIDFASISPKSLKVVGHWEYAREGQHVIREIYKIQKV